MDASLFPILGPALKKAAPYIGAVVIGGAALGYAVHEHRGAQTMAAQNQQVTAQLVDSSRQLDDTHKQLDALNAKVNALVSSNDAKAAESNASAGSAGLHRPAAAHRPSAQDARFKKLQSQLDEQGKAIEAARNDLDTTRGDLTSARTELTGSIARTHDELVVLEKKGQRNYFEFDLGKAKEFKRAGPLSISLRKANSKRQYADLQLIVDDRTLTQKHVNLYQPAMFYEPETQLPVEIVINEISKDHIHGYVSAPKYRPSELAQASDAGAGASAGPDQAAGPGAPPAQRKKLPVPAGEPPVQPQL